MNRNEWQALYWILLVILGVIAVGIGIYAGVLMVDDDEIALPVCCVLTLPFLLLGVLALAQAEMLKTTSAMTDHFDEARLTHDEQFKQIRMQLQMLTLAVSRGTESQPTPKPDETPPRSDAPESTPPNVGELYAPPAESLVGRVIVERAMLRKRPGTGSFYRVVQRDQLLDFTGRDADGRWLRVHSITGPLLWIDVADVVVEGDVSALPVIPEE